jgi:SAM-dependent methyltransferase
MERFQLEFLARTRSIWTADFPIPGDALGHFSRQWEYPYAWARLGAPPGRVLDAGSGITFFPFMLSAAGWTVDCCDEDGALGLVERFEQASNLTGWPVAFSETSLRELRFPDEAFDAVTCISVLEHTGSAIRMVVRELTRVLKPGGRFVLTADLNLSRDDDVRLEDLAVILAELCDSFDFVYPLDARRLPGLLTSDHFLRVDSWRLPWTWRQRPPQAAECATPEFRSIAILGLAADKRRV